MYDAIHVISFSILSEPQNKQKSLARVTSYCIGYKADCDDQSSGYANYCLLHNKPQQHKTMSCSSNPNKWKKSPQKLYDLIK